MAENRSVPHHRRSIRLEGYDYIQAGAYFITICTQSRQCLLGDIVDGVVHLTTYGQIVREEWERTALLSPYVDLDAFVIMPNHFHAILVLTGVGAYGNAGHEHRSPTREQFGNPVAGSIPTIVRGFKAAVSSRVKRSGDVSLSSIWQRNYYEHVVRNDEDMNALREYVAQNPLKWELDQLHPDNPSAW